MGYYVKKLTSKKRPWALQFIEYIGSDDQDIRNVSDEKEMERLGFHYGLTIEQAKDRASQLNKQSRVVKERIRVNAIHRRLKEEQDKQNAILGPVDVAEFEGTFLHQDGYQKDREMHWRKAKKILAELQVEPRNYTELAPTFYEYFRKEAMSYSYVQKVIIALNKWGRFHASKYRDYYFQEIPHPSGKHKGRIEDAFEDANPNTKESDPITIEQIEQKKGALKPELYTWLYIAAAFGLRPIEVDRLLMPPGKRTWAISENPTVDKKTVKVLGVYQTKVRTWKFIPVITKEQVHALTLIEAQKFKRPSAARYVAATFGSGVNLYGPRKGFSVWMRELGQDQVDYSRWLGHSTIQRTEQNYEQKQIISYKPLPQTAKK